MFDTHLDSMAASCPPAPPALPSGGMPPDAAMAAAAAAAAAAAEAGIVGIGTIGPFFGSERLSMLDIEKLVYGEPLDVLLAPFRSLSTAASPWWVVAVELLLVGSVAQLFGAVGLVGEPARADAAVLTVPAAGDLGGLSRESGLWLNDEPVTCGDGGGGCDVDDD